LIVEPVKPLAGFRIYPNETINRIRFIKRAQEPGFSLRDIAITFFCPRKLLQQLDDPLC